jgi:hypothetical protein
MLFYVTLRYIILYYITLYYIILYLLIFSTTLSETFLSLWGTAQDAITNAVVTPDVGRPVISEFISQVVDLN